jgi:hypothetical protein
MTEPGQRERGRNKKQPDNPVKPDHNNGGEAHGDGNQMQRPIDRVIVRAIVMRVETYAFISLPVQNYSAGSWRTKRFHLTRYLPRKSGCGHRDELLKNLVRQQASLPGEPNSVRILLK